MKTFRRTFWTVVFALLAISLFAQTPNPRLVKDINPGTGGANPRQKLEMNGNAYFICQDGNGGSLGWWKSDGTESGTTMIENFISSCTKNISGTLLFTWNDGAIGYELYKSDGTVGGSVLVKDIWVGEGPAPQGGGSYPNSFTAAAGTIFFSARVSSHRHRNPAGNWFYWEYEWELFKTDGTAAGTVMVKDINPGDPHGSAPAGFTPFQNKLFFCATNTTANKKGGYGSELWKTDGTAAGTVLVKDLNPGSGSGMSLPSGPGYYQQSSRPVVFGDALYFLGNNGSTGWELFKSDGTAGGTTLVKDINPSGDSNPLSFTPFNGKLYFTAVDGTHGRALWSTDGTASGTQLVADPNPAGDTEILCLTASGSTLYFAADDGSHGYELWKSDGTGGGTVMVADINPTGSGYPNYAGPGYPIPGYLSGPSPYFTSINGILYFAATDIVSQDPTGAPQGWELWRSDGTATGTFLVKDIYPGSPTSAPLDLIVLNNSLLFTANDGVSGSELWLYDPALPVSPKRHVGGEVRPIGYVLEQNYPNPIAVTSGNSSTAIEYALPADCRVTLKVYDLLGREVIALVERSHSAGRYTVRFNAGNLPSGTYIYRLEAGSVVLSRRMLLMR